jgi:two-component sensor histidine kinase
MSATERFERLPTAAKLFLILTAAILPIGLALVFIGQAGIREANTALDGRSHDRARAAASEVQSLIARNALALRVAAAGEFRDRDPDMCGETAQALATAPAITRQFSLRSMDGSLICAFGGFEPKDASPLVAAGDIKVWLDANGRLVDIRVGVVGGMVTAGVPVAEVRSAALAAANDIQFLALQDQDQSSTIVGDPQAAGDLSLTDWPVGNGSLMVRIGVARQKITNIDRLLLLLPVLMWVAAAFITWLLVTRLLIRPLRRLQRSVTDYHPGDGGLDLPDKLGPAMEIQELRDAFARAVARVDESERDMAGALEGQRRLVREVHHRVKNNLQVVASLLNIHGRGASTGEARAAYAGISRRVGALSIVHRNHYAEMEENRGIALRPLLSELAAELRAGAPEEARGLRIDLDLDSVHTTQDAAIAVSFLVTEIVEFAMLYAPHEPIDVTLRRSSELTARLSLSSRVLVPEEAEQPEMVQFERIIGGLAKQLRSPLDRKLGRYSVELPVFPAR